MFLLLELNCVHMLIASCSGLVYYVGGYNLQKGLIKATHLQN